MTTTEAIDPAIIDGGRAWRAKWRALDKQVKRQIIDLVAEGRVAHEPMTAAIATGLAWNAYSGGWRPTVQLIWWRRKPWMPNIREAWERNRAFVEPFLRRAP